MMPSMGAHLKIQSERMRFVVTLMLLAFAINISRSHQFPKLRHFKTNHTNYRQCLLEKSTNGVGAAMVTDIEAKCHYNSHKDFYYELTWKYPESMGAPVSRFRVKINYRSSRYICFQVPASQRKFRFYPSMGLVYRAGFEFYITAQPIRRVNGLLFQNSLEVWGCPVAPILLPLPNANVAAGTDFSFFASFRFEPIPNVSVSWYFSPDIVHCTNQSVVDVQHRNNVLISRDMSELTILNAGEEDVGCYVVIAHNGIGGISKQRGYLGLNTSASTTWVQSNLDGNEMIYAPFLASLLLLITIIILLVMQRRRRTIRNENTEALLMKTVYVSHCMERQDEIVCLTRFLAALKRVGINVIVDILKQVEIHNAGGFSRWIPMNMERADKILVLLTPEYISAITTSKISIDNNQSENIQKIHSEINFVNNLLLYKEVHEDTNHVVVVKKDVEKTELRSRVLDCRQWYKFPKKADLENDPHFKSIVNIIL